MHATLPAVALAVGVIAELARQVRSALIEVLNSQYIRTLRAKGLAPAPFLWKHGLRNISVTLLTLLGLQVNRLFSGAVVIEAVFAIPGVGSLVATSALNKDFPVVQGVVLVLVVIVILDQSGGRRAQRAARPAGSRSMTAVTRHQGTVAALAHCKDPALDAPRPARGPEHLVLSLLVIVSIFAPVLAPYSPIEQDVT